MLPLSDGIPARRFPIVNVLLIAANFTVIIVYELPHLNAAVYHASFYPYTVDNACWRHGSWPGPGRPHPRSDGDPRPNADTEVRIGLVSGIVNADMNNQY